MKIIVTTSNSYLHILPIFCYLFEKFWDHDTLVEIVGYDRPKMILPENMYFTSLGEQVGDATNFTRDLRKHFAKQDDFFIWMMEDAFLTKPVDKQRLSFLESLARPEANIGRINLTREIVKQNYEDYAVIEGVQVYKNTPTALYRLSTQVSIWNRDYLLANMIRDMSPWDFERQDERSHWDIIGIEDAPVINNEGVRKWNVNEYDFAGLDQSILDDMKRKGII